MVIIGILLISNGVFVVLYFDLRSDLQKSMAHEATLGEQVKSLGTEIKRVCGVERSTHKEISGLMTLSDFPTE
jgi:hypothetical protein